MLRKDFVNKLLIIHVFDVVRRVFVTGSMSNFNQYFIIRIRFNMCFFVCNNFVIIRLSLFFKTSDGVLHWTG